MYKIYINGTPLHLVSSEEVKSYCPSTEKKIVLRYACLLYTSDDADERSSVALGGRRDTKKKKQIK